MLYRAHLPFLAQEIKFIHSGDKFSATNGETFFFFLLSSADKADNSPGAARSPGG